MSFGDEYSFSFNACNAFGVERTFEKSARKCISLLTMTKRDLLLCSSAALAMFGVNKKERRAVERWFTWTLVGLGCRIRDEYVFGETHCCSHPSSVVAKWFCVIPALATRMSIGTSRRPSTKLRTLSNLPKSTSRSSALYAVFRAISSTNQKISIPCSLPWVDKEREII